MRYVSPVIGWAGASRELAACYEAVDWESTSVGDPAGWSRALKSAARMVLDTPFPSTLLWGDDYTLIYNDAYVEIIGEKHPASLGRPGGEVFPEVWSRLEPLLDDVRAGKGSCWFEDDLVPLERHGFLEECYFTFSYSPVRDDERRIEGVIDIVTETTGKVIARRRAEALSRLAEQLVTVDTRLELRQRSLFLLRDLRRDLPAIDLRIPGLPDDPPIPHSGADDPDDALPAAAPVDLAGAPFFVEDAPGGQVVWQTLGSLPRPGMPAPVLVCRVSDHLPFDADYRSFLQLIAASLTQALTRIDLLRAERNVAAAQRDMSVALQHALLSPPQHPDDQQIAVRYVPAADIAQIGGDWYDAFVQTDGALLLGIGDVAGHDLQAAAAMAQIRNLARGIAVATEKSPARVLEHLDHALALLDVDVMATAIFARIERVETGAGPQRRTLRWSRAGHPPPVLLRRDGSAELLEEEAETVLGVFADIERHDLTAELAPGDTVVFYTDGLIERRGVPLDESLELLRSELTGLHGLEPEQICDRLLAYFAVTEQDDDIALMVVRPLDPRR